MSSYDAIVFIPNDANTNSAEIPMMLREMLFCPLAKWASITLGNAGVDRFFVVCHDSIIDEVSKCFPMEATVIGSSSEEPDKILSDFLSENSDGSSFVITKPVFITSSGAKALIYSTETPSPYRFPSAPDSGVYMIKNSTLAEQLSKEHSFDMPEMLSTLGINSSIVNGLYPVSDELSFHTAQEYAKRESTRQFILNGVSFLDASACYVSPLAQIGKGTEILPGTIIKGDTSIGQNCTIGPNTVIDSCDIGSNVTVNASQLNKSSVGNDTNIGPFAYIRPGCAIGSAARIGDFVELKASCVGDGTKISHLTYIGDSELGKKINIGCGTVTVNYDGIGKHKTVIGDGAFIGCNTNLIAPVTVGSGVYTAAGSTITSDVPEDSLAIARSRQTVKKGWVTKNRPKKD